jgi:hypothetical protein
MSPRPEAVSGSPTGSSGLWSCPEDAERSVDGNASLQTVPNRKGKRRGGRQGSGAITTIFLSLSELGPFNQIKKSTK